MNTDCYKCRLMNGCPCCYSCYRGTCLVLFKDINNCTMEKYGKCKLVKDCKEDINLNNQ